MNGMRGYKQLKYKTLKPVAHAARAPQVLYQNTKKVGEVHELPLLF
jgi:hypothetical protein